MSRVINVRAGSPASEVRTEDIRGGFVTPLSGSQQRLIHTLLRKTKQYEEHVWAEHFDEPFNPHWDTLSMVAASQIIGYLKKIEMADAFMRKMQRSEREQIAFEMGEI